MSKQYVIPLYNCLEINKQPINQNIIEKVEWQETKLIVENSEIYNSTLAAFVLSRNVVFIWKRSKRKTS